MSLPTPILQSLISRNRQVITNQHELVVFWKSMLGEEPECPTITVERDVCVKQVVKLSKDIAKLAAVQKELKRELGATTLLKRREQFCSKAKITAMILAGECV
jgi:hypothetical protein